MPERSAEVRFVQELAGLPASVALFEEFVADISERYPGWSPADEIEPFNKNPFASHWLGLDLV